MYSGRKSQKQWVKLAGYSYKLLLQRIYVASGGRPGGPGGPRRLPDMSSMVP